MLILLHWLIYALAILLTAYLLPGVSLAGFGTALVVALVLGLVNAVLRPIFILLTLPLTILTLGAFVLVINTLMVLLTSSVVKGFEVRNFWWALLFGVILSLIHGVLVRVALVP
jgi:putative membrane protein